MFSCDELCVVMLAGLVNRDFQLCTRSKGGRIAVHNWLTTAAIQAVCCTIPGLH